MSLIMSHFGELVFIQILLILVSFPCVIFTKDVEPVEFLLSKNSPRNKTLYIPKPKDFVFLGDTNDCCVIPLFIQVKDLEMQNSGNEAEPPQIDDNEALIETGQVIFQFDHPQIRNDSKTFTMDIKEETVKERHLIHFDKCFTITQVIFFVYANTNITNDKDIRIVVLDGKEQGIECTPLPTPKYEPLPTPKPEKEPKSEPITSTDPTPTILYVATTFSTIVSIILVVYHMTRYVNKSAKKNKRIERNEKCMGGDSDIELEDLPNTTSIISLGGNNSRDRVILSVNEHDIKMSDRLVRWLAKMETYKKQLFIACIVSCLLTVVLVIITVVLLL